MARVKACFAILGVLVIICGVTLTLINSRCDVLAEQVTEISKFTENNKTEKAIEMVDKLDRTWEGDYKLLSCLVRHEKLAELNASLAKLRPLLESNNDEISAEISTILFQISLIKETEFPYLYNIL